MCWKEFLSGTNLHTKEGFVDRKHAVGLLLCKKPSEPKRYSLPCIGYKLEWLICLLSDPRLDSEYLGKKSKSPKQAVRSFRGRARSSKTMKKLFGLFHTKRSHTTKVTSLEENFEFPNVKNWDVSNQQRDAIRRETEEARRGKVRELIQTNVLDSSPSAVVPPFLTPPRRKLTSQYGHSETGQSQSWSHFSRDLLLLDAVSSQASEAGLLRGSASMETSKLGGNDDGDQNVFLDGSYFEDDYWLSYDELCDDVGWNDVPLFSTPYKPGPLYRSTQRVHMGVASLRSSRRHKSLQLENTSRTDGFLDRNPSRRAVKRKHSSLPDDLDKISLESPPVSPLGYIPALETHEVEVELSPGGRQALSDEEIKQLSPLYPSLALNLAFDNTVDDSTIISEDATDFSFDKILKTDPKNVSEGETALEMPRYRLKKPKDLKIFPQSYQTNEMPDKSVSPIIHETFNSTTKAPEEKIGKLTIMEANTCCKQEGSQKVQAESVGFESLASHITGAGDSAPGRSQCGRLRSIESGYGSSSKTPSLKTNSPPDTGRNFFTPHHFPIRENCSPNSSDFFTPLASLDARDLARVNRDQEDSLFLEVDDGGSTKNHLEHTAEPGLFSRTQCVLSSLDEPPAINSRTGAQQRRESMELEQTGDKSPVKRSLKFSDDNLDSTETSPGLKKLEDISNSDENTRQASVKQDIFMPYLSDVCDENNNCIQFDANALFQRLSVMSEESLSASVIIPMPISSSSPMQKMVREKNDKKPEQSKSPSGGTDSASLIIGTKQSSSTDTSPEPKPAKITRIAQRTKRNMRKSMTTDKMLQGMDINNNPVNLGWSKIRRPLGAREASSSEDSDDECKARTSHTRTDYILIRRVAEKILSRIPEECSQRDNLNTVRVMGFLHQYYNREVALLSKKSLSTVNTTQARNGAKSRNGKYKKSVIPARNLIELKEIYEHMLENLSLWRLTVSNCIGVLLAALLADRKDVVDESCDFAFRNIRLLGKSSELFYASPPEVVLMLLSNKHSKVIGFHGFPIRYENAEREILLTAHLYCRRRRTGNRETDRKLRDMIISAADPEVWDKQRRFHLWKKHPKSEHKEDDVKDPILGRKHCRVRYDIAFHQSEIFAKIDEESLGAQLVPDVFSTLKTDEISGVNLRNRKSQIVQHSGGLSLQLDGLNRMSCMANEQGILDTCTDGHSLHHLWFSFRRRNGIPYMTGLQLCYIFNGQMQRIAIGDFNLKTCVEKNDPNRGLSRAKDPATSGLDEPASRGIKNTCCSPKKKSFMGCPLHPQTTTNTRGPFCDEMLGSADRADDPRPLRTVLKLDIGEHIVCVRVQTSSGKFCPLTFRFKNRLSRMNYQF